MKIEIESAANFLLNLLRLHSHILVDQLELFRESLLESLALHYKEHWFPDKPCKGSGYRCLRINHKLDPVIAKAGLTCGLDESSLKSLLPNELTVWIDPSEVSYRIGENGSICVLYDADSKETKPEASKEGISRSTPNKKIIDEQSTNRTFASSPSESSLSSTTSTLSSPSPSSSPDWCVRDRISPVSTFPGGSSRTLSNANSLHSGVGDIRYPDALSMNGYVLNSNAMNIPVSRVATQTDANHWPHYHWSPTRLDNYGIYQAQQYQQHQSRRHCQVNQQAQIQHLHHPKSSSHQGYSSWDSFILDKAVTGRHHTHHLNTNLEQLAALS